MNHLKRQLNIDDSSDEQNKKLQTSSRQEIESVSCIEDLSNELFYDIFDYLDGCKLFEIFSNLNIRFDNLLASSSLRLKITFLPFLELGLRYRYMNIICSNKHKVVSLQLLDRLMIDRLLTLIPVDSSFLHLESLVLYGLKTTVLTFVLVDLKSLSSLVSLTIYMDDNMKNFNELYRLIFRLPALKYNKLYSETTETFVQLTFLINNRFSTIEYLIIDHSCTFNGLLTMLSYTPHLHRLICGKLIRSIENIMTMTLTLSNLTHVSIKRCDLHFDEFELFIKNISSQLRMLRISTYRNEAYLDANRWEQLISKHLCYLQRFYFDFIILFSHTFAGTQQYQSINKFTSPFWIKRGWIFHIKVDTDITDLAQIHFCIDSHRQRWHESIENDEYSHDQASLPVAHQTTRKNTISSAQISKDIELIVTIPPTSNNNELFINGVSSSLTMARITQLDISDVISGDILVGFIRILPNLDSLRIHSLTKKGTFQFYGASNNNNITKVNLLWATGLTHIDFLFNLCLRMQHLELGCSNDMSDNNLKVLLRYTLMKNRNCSSHLRTFCLRIRKKNYKMIEELQNIINIEKLFQSYTVKRVYDGDDLLYVLSFFSKAN